MRPANRDAVGRLDPRVSLPQATSHGESTGPSAPTNYEACAGTGRRWGIPFAGRRRVLRQLSYPCATDQGRIESHRRDVGKHPGQAHAATDPANRSRSTVRICIRQTHPVDRGILRVCPPSGITPTPVDSPGPTVSSGRHSITTTGRRTRRNSTVSNTSSARRPTPVLLFQRGHRRIRPCTGSGVCPPVAGERHCTLPGRYSPGETFIEQ